MMHYNDYLIHDGQKGMHWGIRKYRNYDGTLTPAGKIRYDYSDGGSVTKKKPTRAERKAAKAKEKERKAKEKEREAKKAAEELKKKQEEFSEEQKKAAKERIEVQKLSNEELKAAIDRLNLERQYTQLVNPPAPKVETAPKVSKVERAKNFLGQLAGAGQSIASLYDTYQKIDRIRNPEKYEKQDPLKALKLQEEKERLKASIDKSKYEVETRNRTRSERSDKDAQKAASWAADAMKSAAYAASWTSSWSNKFSDRYGSSNSSVKSGSSFVNNSGLLALPAPSSSQLALPPGNPFSPPQSYYDNKRR